MKTFNLPDLGEGLDLRDDRLPLLHHVHELLVYHPQLAVDQHRDEVLREQVLALGPIEAADLSELVDAVGVVCVVRFLQVLGRGVAHAVAVQHHQGHLVAVGNQGFEFGAASSGIRKQM